MSILLLGLWGRVLAFVKLVPVWVWIVAIALAWGAWQRHTANSVAAEFSKAKETAAAEREQSLQLSIDETNRRLLAQTQVTDEARKQTLLARAQAGAAGAAAERLRNQLAAKPADPTPGNPTSASGSEAAVLAQLLSVCAARYRALAGIADEAIVAGKACESSYQSLTK